MAKEHTEQTPDQTNAIGAAIAAGIAEGIEKGLHKQRPERYPQSPDYPGVSAFNPDGDNVRPKPEFHRRVFVNGHPEERDMLTREEIEDYNALSVVFKNPGDRRHATINGQINPRWLAKISENGDELHIIFPCKSQEDFAFANSLSARLIARMFLDGKPITNANDMLDEMDRMKSRIAELEARR
jgi:hypothetical protein